MRAFHCNALRKLDELNTPVSIIGVLQGKFEVAVVPQVLGKMSAAVFTTPVTVAPLGV